MVDAAASIAVCAALASAGCAHYEARPLAPAHSADALAKRSLASPDLKLFFEQRLHQSQPDWPRRAWDLDSLTSAAVFYNPGLAVARAQWETLAAGRKTAAGRPNPVVGMQGGYNFDAARAAGTAAVNPWIPGATLDVPIETFGKRGLRIQRSQHIARAAELNLTTVLWQIRGQLRSALLDGSLATRRQELLRAQVSVQDRIGQLLEQRFQAGALSSLELSANRVARIKLGADLAEAQRLGIESRQRLAEAVGIPAEGLQDLRLDPPAALPDRLPADLPALRRQALLTRADVRSALAAYDASQSALQLEIAKQYPDLHVGNGYQWDQGDNKWSFGINLELPVLNQNQGPIAEAEAHRREAAAQVLAVQARAIAEIDRAAAVGVAMTQQRERLKDVHDELDRQTQLQADRLRAGGADVLELETARLDASMSALALLDADVKATAAAGQLEDALQVPLPALAAIESAVSSTENPPP